MNKTVLQQVEQIIGYEFSDKRLLRTAFTHSSVVDNPTLSNERLEFLGDSVLGVVVCQTLFERFPSYLEGELTKIKSMIVSRKTCAKLATELGLLEFLNLGKGVNDSRALMGSLIAALIEAIIGAIYIDGGFEAARDFILRIFGPLIEQADAKHIQGNFKSLLQQFAQQHFNATPVYELLDEKGPDHDKCFETHAVISGRHFPSAWGTNKKEAEQKAAQSALIELGVLKKKSPDTISD